MSDKGRFGAKGLNAFAAAFDLAANGWITIIAGDTAAGIRVIEAAFRSAGYGSSAQGEAPGVHLELDVVMAAYRPTRAAGVSTLGTRLNDVGVFWPMMRLRYAQGLDSLGRHKEAAEQYARFAQVWKGADPALRHFGEEAKARAGVLGGR